MTMIIRSNTEFKQQKTEGNLPSTTFVQGLLQGRRIYWMDRSLDTLNGFFNPSIPRHFCTREFQLQLLSRPDQICFKALTLAGIQVKSQDLTENTAITNFREYTEFNNTDLHNLDLNLHNVTKEIDSRAKAEAENLVTKGIDTINQTLFAQLVRGEGRMFRAFSNNFNFKMIKDYCAYICSNPDVHALSSDIIMVLEYKIISWIKDKIKQTPLQNLKEIEQFVKNLSIEFSSFISDLFDKRMKFIQDQDFKLKSTVNEFQKTQIKIVIKYYLMYQINILNFFYQNHFFRWSVIASIKDKIGEYLNINDADFKTKIDILRKIKVLFCSMIPFEDVLNRFSLELSKIHSTENKPWRDLINQEAQLKIKTFDPQNLG